MKKLTLALFVVVAAGALWRARTQDAPNPKLLFDRFWIDHEPRDPKETFRAVFVSGEAPFGHFANRTIWTGQWEGFHYHVVPREEGRLDCFFGNTEEWQQLRYAARPCKADGFDYCLEVSGTSRGVRRYYSKKEWGVRSTDDVDGLLARLAH